MDKTEHSPLPWRVSPHDGTYLLDANGREVCETGSYTTERDVMKADARLIVTAVNSHAALIDACTEALEQLELLAKNPSDNWWCQKLRAALSAAKGEKA